MKKDKSTIVFKDLIEVFENVRFLKRFVNLEDEYRFVLTESAFDKKQMDRLSDICDKHQIHYKIKSSEGIVHITVFTER